MGDITQKTLAPVPAMGLILCQQRLVMRSILALACSLVVAYAAITQQPTPTELAQVTATTLQAGITPLATPDTSVEYYTSTNLITIPGETNDVLTRAGQTITIAIPTCRQTAIPDSNGHVPAGSCGALWNYYPSFTAAAVFTALFIVLLAVHSWQAIAYRKVREYPLAVFQWNYERLMGMPLTKFATAEVVLGHHNSLCMGDDRHALSNYQHEKPAV
jgi:hypothetical protein